MIWLLSLISALFYRLGGLSVEDGRKAFPFLPDWVFNTKARDIGVPLIGAITMAVMGINATVWAILLSFGAYWGALSTYFEGWFGYDNIPFHLFMASFAYIFYCIATGHWIAMLIRAVICGLIGWGLTYTKNDWAEELGRGFTLNITLLLWTI